MAWLPARLPSKPDVRWRVRLPSRGLGGVAATKRHVFVSARETMDSVDAYYCLDADTGKEVWRHLNPAPAEKELDYGNSPRATPLVHGKHVFFHGAFGHLHCVEIDSGKVVWEKDLRDEFGAKDERKWGTCSSPLVADRRLIVNPGGPDASLVALEPETGKVLWKTRGNPASYGNFVAATLGGKRQVVGFDLESLGGWDVATGKRLWRVEPERRSDFNVPTPLVVGGRLVVAWENNGTFVYEFGTGGVIRPKPVATYPRLAPDTHTPVATAGRVFGAWGVMHCLDAKALTPVWQRRAAAYGKYLTLVATDDRVLAVTLAGELVLLDATAEEYREVGRLAVLDEDAGVHAHPAFVGTRVYLRGDAELLCVDLGREGR